MFEVLSGCNIIGHGLFGSMEISSTPPTNYDNIEMEGIGSVTLPNSLKAPIERLQLLGNSVQTSTTGKNLFDITKLKSGFGSVVIDGDKITLPSGGAIYFTAIKNTCPDLKVGDEIYIFADTTSSNKNVYLYPESGLTALGSKITVKSLDDQLLLYSDTKTNTVTNLMFTKVNDKTYEPYTGGKPSPSVEYPQEIVSCGKWNEETQKHEINVKLSGKNLVPHNLDFVPYGNNDPKTIEFDPKTNSYKLITRPDNYNQVSCYVKFNLKKGIYTITRKIKIDGVDITKPAGLQIIDADTKENLFYQHTGINRKFELKEDTNVLINLGHITNKTQKEAIIYEVQLEKSDVPTPYEPYHEQQTLQLQLDEPLRGIGEHKDVITKDGVLRKVGTVRLADTLGKVIEGKPGGKYIFSGTPNGDLRYNKSRLMINVGFEKMKPYENSIIHYVNDDDTVETVKERIKDATAVYVLKEPILEPLETDLGNLQTYSGTTIISVDSGEVETGIKLTYRKEK